MYAVLRNNAALSRTWGLSWSRSGISFGPRIFGSTAHRAVGTMSVLGKLATIGSSWSRSWTRSLALISAPSTAVLAPSRVSVRVLPAKSVVRDDFWAPLVKVSSALV
jgi:hypothetical protein